MQNNVELQSTLDELCTDLFATTTLDDCNAILQSLALLAETFPQAQSLLGRLLSRDEDNLDRPRYSSVSKLSALSTNFLYKKETACSAVSLLVALANDNVRNQRRIVESVTGVKLDIGERRSPATERNLYVLTVPDVVASSYRRWRKRQRELQNCRLPSGVPPAHNGAPMPCYCDGCLGAEQLLATWQQHFHDLSRWRLDPDKESHASSCFPLLSTEEFFLMFLEEYQLRSCTVEEALGNQKEAQGPYTNIPYKRRGLVYYFVSPEEAIAVTPRTPVHFNPVHHISAIAVAAEIDITAARTARLKQSQLGTMLTASPSVELEESRTLAPDQVILLTSVSDVNLCDLRPLEYEEEKEEILDCPHPVPDNNERLLADFLRFEEQHGQPVQCDSLVGQVSDEDETAETTKQLLLYMLAFCEGGDQLPLPTSPRSYCTDSSDDAAISNQVDEVESSPLNVKITMTAKLSECILQIDCYETGNSSRSFSTCILQRKLLGVSKTRDEGGLSLLCLSDEALESLLPCCRICSCDKPGQHPDSDSVFYLRPSTPEEEQRVSSPETNDKVDRTAGVEDDALKLCSGTRVPLSGLSSEAKLELGKLETLVAETNYRRLTCEALSRITEKIAKVVADCNKRISNLSTARDKKIVRATTEVHRAAAISRCRHCRDLLIQLGKKLALKLSPLDPSVPIPLDKLVRVAKLVRFSIQEVLTNSESFDPWETPDARVERLQLDRHVWASGFPDAAYYQDTDTRRRENRKKQQQLSRKLLQKRAKQRGE
ncbi:hypothetical protein V7S43_004372 [Phytophthora oleae]|uniref:Uncharacterized protein n=1 Tax=Phytophthora oleae TaxID=2107226 RepID=A0ABD3FW97_9STRA